MCWSYKIKNCKQVQVLGIYVSLIIISNENNTLYNVLELQNKNLYTSASSWDIYVAYYIK